MKQSDIKLIQKELAAAGLYLAEIDGKRGPNTNRAIAVALAARSADLPGHWRDWSAKRRAVAYLQLLCHDSEIDAGVIDGFYGPQTESGAGQLKILRAKGFLPRGFGDIVPVRANPHNFPLEEHGALTEYYQKPCESRLVKVECPWQLRLDWDLNSRTKTITIHEKVADSLSTILAKVYEAYGPAGIKEHGLDRYGGSYNCRQKRGSMAAWSTHAWGIAIDWYPSRNKLKWDCEKASLAHPDLDGWWQIWEEEGWLSLGRMENRDWMHVQSARR
ncbi:MAG: M15 family peptidase [Thermodesulfobacteriota bacterium]